MYNVVCVYVYGEYVGTDDVVHVSGDCTMCNIMFTDVIGVDDAVHSDAVTACVR